MNMLISELVEQISQAYHDASALRICGGNTKAIKGTVSKGVPTPNAPLMSPPKNRATPHQPTINQSANVIHILFL